MLTSHGGNRANALSPKVIESNDCIRYSLALMRWIHISPMILGPVIIIEVVGQPKSVLEIYTTITTCNMNNTQITITQILIPHTPRQNPRMIDTKLLLN